MWDGSWNLVLTYNTVQVVIGVRRTKKNFFVAIVLYNFPLVLDTDGTPLDISQNLNQVYCKLYTFG